MTGSHLGKCLPARACTPGPPSNPLFPLKYPVQVTIQILCIPAPGCTHIPSQALHPKLSTPGHNPLLCPTPFRSESSSAPVTPPRLCLQSPTQSSLLHPDPSPSPLILWKSAALGHLAHSWTVPSPHHNYCPPLVYAVRLVNIFKIRRWWGIRLHGLCTPLEESSFGVLESLPCICYVFSKVRNAEVEKQVCKARSSFCLSCCVWSPALFPLLPSLWQQELMVSFRSRWDVHSGVVF